MFYSRAKASASSDQLLRAAEMAVAANRPGRTMRRAAARPHVGARCGGQCPGEVRALADGLPEIRQGRPPGTLGEVVFTTLKIARQGFCYGRSAIERARAARLLPS